jgi:hypothetical protein
LAAVEETNDKLMTNYGSLQYQLPLLLPLYHDCHSPLTIQETCGRSHTTVKSAMDTETKGLD